MRKRAVFEELFTASPPSLSALLHYLPKGTHLEPIYLCLNRAITTLFTLRGNPQHHYRKYQVVTVQLFNQPSGWTAPSAPASSAERTGKISLPTACYSELIRAGTVTRKI
ncbi:MAG: hypothetical protein ACLS6W_07710 [Ruminococcus sp.]